MKLAETFEIIVTVLIWLTWVNVGGMGNYYGFKSALFASRRSHRFIQNFIVSFQ